MPPHSTDRFTTRRPKDIVDRLNQEIRAALSAPETAEQLALEGTEIGTNNPASFRDHITRETDRRGDLVKRTGVKPE